MSPAAFTACLQGIWTEAEAAGVSRATFDAAFSGVTADNGILPLIHKQAEFVRPVWDYLDGSITPTRIEKGRANAETYASVLSSLEQQYGVDASAVIGVWGMESNYNTHSGGSYVVRSLATLACAGYREGLFRQELVPALQILQEGHVTRDAMRGSWAGAMGLTQFMPSSFMKYAVDFDGDGRKDIWNDVPDALASTANFLEQHGWLRGQPWGFEVHLPAGFQINGNGRTVFRSFAAWARLGVGRADGNAMPESGEGALFLPAGASGPTFLITRNFTVLKAYNTSDSYAVAVGLLGDRALGGGPVVAAWPRGQKQLSFAECLEIQRLLLQIGYDVGKHDGHIGEKTSEAVRAFQLKTGMLADGYPSPAVLARLKTYPH